MSTDITISAVDQNGATLFKYKVPFTLGISVKEVMETAFVLNQQSAPNADPFLYTVEYYGYSEVPQFPVYLGYEIEGIGVIPNGVLANNTQFYWELEINGQVSQTGADTAYPPPGSTVVWNYRTIPANPERVPARTRIIHARRAARKARRNS